MSTALFNRKRANVEGQKTGYTKLYLALVSEFTTLQKPGTVTNPEDAYTIATDHAFGVGGGFAEVYVLPRTHTADGSTFGEEGALNSLHNPKFFIPGDGAKTLALVEYLLNKELIVLQKEPTTANGAVQYGDADTPAYISSRGFESGSVFEGKKGYTFELVAPSKYFYTGDITVRS